MLVPPSVKASDDAGWRWREIEELLRETVCGGSRRAKEVILAIDDMNLMPDPVALTNYVPTFPRQHSPAESAHLSLTPQYTYLTSRTISTSKENAKPGT